MIDLAALLRFPCDRDKHPLITAWQKNAARRDHSRWPLVGVPTGAVNGFDVLDIDLEALGWRDQNRDRFPFTQVHTTRSGGWHFLFRHHPGLRNSASRIAPGVDVRADGGFIIWWPREGLPFTTAEFAPWPEWLLAMARGDGSVLKRPYEGSGPSTHHGKPYRRTFNPKARIATLMHRLEGARFRTRNDTLNATAYVFGRMIAEGCIRTREDAEWLLRSGATINGLWRDPFDGPDKCKATIKSGLDAGIQDEMRDREQRPEYGLYRTGSILHSTLSEITE
jgi:hypothetical protein